MSAAAADHGHGPENGSQWWWWLAVFGAVGLGLMLFFILTGQPWAEWAAYFGTGLVTLSNSLTNSRQGIMMLIQFGIAVGACIFIIKMAIGNRMLEKKIAALEQELLAAKAKPAAAAH